MYFGLNSVGGLLSQFSEVPDKVIKKEGDGTYTLKGFDLFNPEVVADYIARKQDEGKTAKNMFSDPVKTDIFEEMGVTRAHIMALLQQTSPAKGKTVGEFLATANADQRMAFFRDDPTGMSLLGAYVLILCTAKEMKKTLTTAKPYVCAFAQRPSATYEPTLSRMKNGLGQGVVSMLRWGDTLATKVRQGTHFL